MKPTVKVAKAANVPAMLEETREEQLIEHKRGSSAIYEEVIPLDCGSDTAGESHQSW